MDHVWQIGHLGPPEHEMLEAYTTLGWLAARTERVKLLTVVTAVVSFYAVERPILRLKDRFRQRSAPAEQAPVPS